MAIEQNTQANVEERDLSIVIRCGRDKEGLLRCLNSVDVSAEIVISCTQDASFLLEPSFAQYILAPHAYGNWSVAAETGLQAARNNNIIIMDSDSRFASGAITLIYNTLKEGHLLVQPRVVFLIDNTWFSQLISNARSHENRYQPKAYSPGLGFKRAELIERIGVDGHIYNQHVLYGDDGYVDQRAKAAGVDVYVAEDALIYHDPISLKHELIAAFRFGQGEYQLEENPTSVWTQIILGLLNQDARDYLRSAQDAYGNETLCFMVLWRLLYVAGYAYEKKKNATHKK